MDLYSEAAAILGRLQNKQGSVKSLVFASQFKNVRQLYALVCESLKHQSVLQAVLEKCSDLHKEEALSSQPHLATVLLYEHLLGKGLGRAGRIRSCLLRHKQQIKQACSSLLQEQGVESLSDLLSAQCQTMNSLPIPRYARVNLLKTTVDEMITGFEAEGWVWHSQLQLESFVRGVQSLGEDGFAVDPLLPDVLIFPPGTDLHDHPFTQSAKIILQDRASCFPAHVLAPPEGATVLDCCAAPGNKTSHTASLLGNSGSIVAYERDGKRVTLLRQQLKKCEVTNTRTVHADFLSVNPHDPSVADVQYILVDPSCSGSGIVSRMDHVADNKKSSEASSQRLQNLARFQISILKHALQFPATQRVVYSTCSVHEEENEAVVAEVAAQVHKHFTVTKIFPEWPHRGVGESEVAGACLRMSPEKDLTNGFFVACFDRVVGSENGLQATGFENYSEAEQKSIKRLKRKRKFEDENGEFDVEGCAEKQAENCSNVFHSAHSSPGAEESETKSQTKKKKRKKDKVKQLETDHNCNLSAELLVKTETEILQAEHAVAETHSDEGIPRKRKKKKRANIEVNSKQEDSRFVIEEDVHQSEFKSCVTASSVSPQGELQIDNLQDEQKRKKSKKKGSPCVDIGENSDIDQMKTEQTDISSGNNKRKKKKRKHNDRSSGCETVEYQSSLVVKKKKKKKKA